MSHAGSLPQNSSILSSRTWLPTASKTTRRLASNWQDMLFHGVSKSMALIVLAVLALAAASMFWGGYLAFSTFGVEFFTSTEWDAVGQRFGALVPIYGTLVTAFIAIAIAVPISLGIAIFLTEIAPRFLAGPIGLAVELLAGIPSIIYGMWGLFVFVPFMAQYVAPGLDQYFGALPLVGPLFQGPPLGIGMLTGSIILAIMIIPFISSIMRDVFLLTPAALKESAYALGCTRWEVIRHMVLPHTRSAVVGAVFLGLGRALGETMAVTFVLGNAHDISASLLMPGNSIAATLANEFAEADSELYRSATVALGFILFIVTFVVLAAAKFMLGRLKARDGGHA